MSASAKAKVTVSLEIDLSDRWGVGTMIQQVLQQGGDGATNIIDKMIRSTPNVRMIGKPKVLVVL